MNDIINVILCTTPLYNLDKTSNLHYHSTLNSHLQRLDSGKLDYDLEKTKSIVCVSFSFFLLLIHTWISKYTYSHIFIDIISIS